MNIYPKKLKTLLTEDNDFNEPQHQFAFPQKPLGVLANNPANNMSNRFPSNMSNKLPNIIPNFNRESNIPPSGIKSTLLTGVMQEMLSGEKTQQRIAEQKTLERQTTQIQKTQNQAMEKQIVHKQSTPISEEEDWYPVTTAQRKKEAEDRLWIVNNPNAA